MMNPFIPAKKANIAIISSDAPLSVLETLEGLIPNVVQTIPLPNVARAVSRHPDMAMIPVNKNTLIVAPSVYKHYRSVLEPLGLVVIQGKAEPGENYPYDVPYNAAILGGKAFHLKKFTDSKVKDELRNIGLEILNVRQGYTKCSIAIIDENSAITSDLKLAVALRHIGCDVLLIEPGQIELLGMKYGFIGGSVGILSPSELLVAGSLRSHSSWLRMEAFMKERGIKIIELCTDKAVDLGTILTFSRDN